MILQRLLALSSQQTSKLFCQSVTPTNSAAVILHQKLTFCDNNHGRNDPADKTQNSSLHSDDEERQLKLIKLEISNLHENGLRAPNPECINKNQWNELLQLKSKSSRNKYYNFLFLKEKLKENLLLKKQEKRLAFEEMKTKLALESPEAPIVSTFKNRFMLRIRPKTMDNSKLARATLFGEQLIFDLSYDPHMTRREASNTAKQLTLCFADNRRHIDPFDFHFCNAIPDSNAMKYLEQCIPTVRNKGFPLNLHEGSFLDLFPKEKLVYLTPHCKFDLVEYNPDDIYIIGAMVDKMNHQPISLGKAKSLGIRMARLPLDRYLKWNGGSGKSLTLNQMTRIMLDIKTTRDWSYSLKHVPTRKIDSGAVPPMKMTRKWTAAVDKPKFDFYTQQDDNTMSTADKFKKKIQWNKNSKFDFSPQKDHNDTMSTADKFKQKIQWNKNWQFDSSPPKDHNDTMSTADKFKQKIQWNKNSKFD